MSSSSKNPVTSITNQLHNANIRNISAMKLRQAVGSVKALSVATEERVYNKGKDGSGAQENPWNVCKSHLNLLPYDDDVPLEDWNFSHSEWTIQFKNMLLEHHSVQVIDEALVELGPKISTDPPNCRPTYGSMISTRMKIDLSKPLYRGGWWNTRAGGVTWVRYHWERQPHNLCTHCWTVNHNKEECANVAHDLKIRRYTNEKYINYIHGLAETYGVEICEDMDLLIQRICEASKKQINEQGYDHEDTRRPKSSRSTEEENDEPTDDLDINELHSSPTSIEFDGMEHDLVEEGENITKIYPQVMDEVADSPTFLYMKILSWNCQGFLGKDTRDHLIYLNNLHHPEIIFICDTKINDSRIIILSNFLGMPNMAFALSVGLAGSLLLLWKDGFSLNIDHQDDKIFHTRVTNDACKGEWNTDFNNTTSSAVLDLIKDSDLTDLGFCGNPYTWSSNKHGTGRFKSRIDRALGNREWYLVYPNSILRHIPHYGSDHAPILLDISNQDRNSFSENIKTAWSTNFLSELISLQDADVNGSNTEAVILLESEIRKLNEIQASSNRQKSRDHFYNDMDMNLRFFHIIMNRRKCRNRIDSLMAPNGTWCNDRDSLSNLLKQHFQNIMTTSNPSSIQHFIRHIPRCIYLKDNEQLEAIPSEQEIHQALMTMEPWTSPGPDGFPPGFYQTQWQVVNADVCKMIKSFFHSGFLVQQLNNTIVSLIPKVQIANKPKYFRPIALCNTVYKIISKIIALRMKKHIAKIISPMQSAYVSGRLISENICLVQEIVQSMKRKEGLGGHLALKMDMSKAFNRLEWSFLLDILKQFGFSEKFRQFISQCISTTHIEVMLNGSPTTSFKTTRRIRQGDPLSPYLFILAMESFSRFLPHCEATGKLTGMKISRSAPKTNHLLFADDCILFCKANDAQVQKLLSVIHQFSICLGQLINFNKSTVFFSSNLSPKACQNISGDLQVRSLNISDEKYLGIPFFVGRRKRIPFSILCDKMDHRFANWNGSNMSEEARSVMIKNVSNAIPMHHMTSFKLPDVTIKKMSSKQRQFWRNKK
ncbi:uncharacterized protein LOC113315813 [Papaver somniferum]|uniref:uncharacterized protein LOC113315813 n=1 Tax=Papaver somniferum TaxID=3469 RepID=UPI000E705502|nr:uncharacterized protein LOC113315813 [Papaver somniferum]